MAGTFRERRPVHQVIEAIAASVCGYLAWLGMFLILDQLPRLVLAAVTRIQVIAFDPSLVIPNWQTRLPDKAARNLFSLYFTSVPIWGLVLLSVGPAVSRRLRGWAGIFAAQATLIGRLVSSLSACSVQRLRLGRLARLPPRARGIVDDLESVPRLQNLQQAS